MFNYSIYLEFKKKHPDIDIKFMDVIVLLIGLSSPSEEIKEEMNLDSYFKELQNKQLIKIVGDKIVLRPLGEELLNNESKTDDILVLAQRIRDLFPKGIKSGGYPIRSNVYDIADKLKKFMKKHKYSPELIIKATENYIKRKETEGWNFTQIAVYFIEKNGMSTLASECEGLIEGDSYKEPMKVNKML